MRIIIGKGIISINTFISEIQKSFKNIIAYAEDSKMMWELIDRGIPCSEIYYDVRKNTFVDNWGNEVHGLCFLSKNDIRQFPKKYYNIVRYKKI